MDSLTIALWPVAMAAVPTSVADAAACIETRLAEAASAGARLLMLPEYLAEQWLAWAPPDLPETEEVAWMGRHGAALLELLRPLPARYDTALLAGSWPARVASGWINRAHLLLPDGRIATPSEQDPDG